MANFEEAFEALDGYEGGYVFDPKDRGGETYRGVSRKWFPKWEGWVVIDLLKDTVKIKQSSREFARRMDNLLSANIEIGDLVAHFYECEFWDRIKADDINNQHVATSMFTYAVLSGVRTSSALAQKAVDAKPDGIIGPHSLKLINKCDSEKFLAEFTLLKIARVTALCEKDPSQRRFFFGWVRRFLGGASA